MHFMFFFIFEYRRFPSNLKSLEKGEGVRVDFYCGNFEPFVWTITKKVAVIPNLGWKQTISFISHLKQDNSWVRNH